MVFSASSVFIRDCGTPLVHEYYYSVHSCIYIFILYPDIARASSSVILIVAHLGYRHSY